MTGPPMLLYKVRLPKKSHEPGSAGPPTVEAAVARALDTPRINLETIGKAIGVSRFALVKYRNGQRPIPAERRIRLADYLEAHARQVLADATALRAGG
jgi:hypothetical protein